MVNIYNSFQPLCDKVRRQHSHILRQHEQVGGEWRKQALQFDFMFFAGPAAGIGMKEWNIEAFGKRSQRIMISDNSNNLCCQFTVSVPQKQVAYTMVFFRYENRQSPASGFLHSHVCARGQDIFNISHEFRVIGGWPLKFAAHKESARIGIHELVVRDDARAEFQQHTCYGVDQAALISAGDEGNRIVQFPTIVRNGATQSIFILIEPRQAECMLVIGSFKNLFGPLLSDDCGASKDDRLKTTRSKPRS